MTYEIRPAGEGGWLALAAGTTLLVVPRLDDATAALTALSGADGFQAALDLLTSRGLAATPPFVLIESAPGSDARVIVRGEVTVTVTGADGEQHLAAAGVSTWVERIVPGATSVAIVVPGVSAIGEHALPLSLGAALVASVSTTGAMPSASAPPNAARAAVQPTASLRAAAPSVAAAPPAVTSPFAAETPAPLEEATVIVDADETPTPPAAPEVDERGYDYLFGDTMYRSVADAAVVVPDPDAAPAPAADDRIEAPGDHDGRTVLTSDLAKVRGRKARASAPKAEAAAPASRFVLVISTTGAREPLTTPVLVGRSPSVSQVSGAGIPKLLALGSGDQDISRNHAQIGVEGGTAVVTDLHSKNGTTIILPGKEAQRLRPGEPTAVIVGTVIDLGGVTLTLDED